MRRQKSPQITFSDPDDPANSVRDQIVISDPPVDRAGGDAETFRHLGDREEFDLIAALTAITDLAESSQFPIAVGGGPSSRPHLAGLGLC